MNEQFTVAAASEPAEPSGITIADLSMLVVGFALAFSLPRLHHRFDPKAKADGTNLPMPGWSAELLVLQEMAVKCGLVAVPLILVRRARYGGSLRPPE